MKTITLIILAFIFGFSFVVFTLQYIADQKKQKSKKQIKYYKRRTF